MDEKLIRRTQFDARDSYSNYKRYIDRADKDKESLESKRKEFDEQLVSAPENISIGRIQQIGTIQRNLSDSTLQAEVLLAADKKAVAENLDAYRNAALSDAALADVQIELQQPEDAGQQIDVHTPEQQ